MRHSDSVSRAEERRRVFSRRRERRISVSVGRLTSKAGDAMGESSVVIVKMPSKGRSGKGFVTSAETLTRTLRQYVSIKKKRTSPKQNVPCVP